MLKPEELESVRSILLAIREVCFERDRLAACEGESEAKLKSLMKSVVGEGRVIRVPEGFSAAGQMMIVTRQQMKFLDDTQNIYVLMNGPLLTDSGRITDQIGSVNVCLASYNSKDDVYELINYDCFGFYAEEIATLTQALLAARGAIRGLGETNDKIDHLVAIQEQNLTWSLPFRPGALVQIDMHIFRIVKSKCSIGFHTEKKYEIEQAVIEVGCEAEVVQVGMNGVETKVDHSMAWPVATMLVETGHLVDCDMVSIYENWA